MATSSGIFSFYSSPEQIQTLANFGHNVSGYLLCLIAALFLFAEFGYYRERLTLIYSAIFIAMPVSFIGYVLFSNGVTNIPTIAAITALYPEVYLHILTLVGNLFGGIGEILYVRGWLRFPLGALYLPVLFLVDGFLSILHVHGAGGHHDIFHNVYGSLMVFAGLLIIAERLITPAYRKYFIPLAALFMVIPGLMLVSFKEPVNAYSYAFPTSTSSSTSVYATKDASVIVYISSSGIVPHDIQIHQGATITFIKLDDSVHEIASGPHPQHNNFPPLNIGVMMGGEAKTVTFTKVGFFGYHDHINDDDMRFQGSVVVTK